MEASAGSPAEHRLLAGPWPGPSAPATDDLAIGPEAGVLSPGSELAQVATTALAAGLRRVGILAWRDLDDPEAGGSELHAHRVASSWAEAGLDVTMRTSAVSGAPALTTRHGYQVIRRSGRYGVFPRAMAEGFLGRRDLHGVVEVWNGVPFLTPLWCRRAHVAFIHHVHADMWAMTLPPNLARLGRLLERRLAPPLYRRSPVVTLSESSRLEIVRMLRLPPARVRVVPPGVDGCFAPGPGRSPTPMVLSVGRLVPVKRFPMLVQALVAARRRVGDLRAVIVGEGYARPELEAAVAGAGAQGWIELRGHVDQDELVALYRQAWVLASASKREGWGMSISEAAACGTPAVVSRIAGHIDAVVDGVSGVLVDTADDMGGALASVLADRLWRERLRRGAMAHVSGLQWSATAAGTLSVLLGEHRAARSRH
ncbi:MAG TPA: glycosyltransferase family 4 protein [Acidimicrobiales bacterium]|nr:glycosyltransferase family 4 protein [Acidimicrobiales bacterium]